MNYTTTQLKAKETVYDNRYVEFNAQELATKVARQCHGIWDWNGCQIISAPSGLARLANAWLRKNHPDKNARVNELAGSNGESRYEPCWEMPKSTKRPARPAKEA